MTRAAKLAAIAAAIADQWPLREIYRTHHTSARFVNKHFPGYRGISAAEAGALSMAARHCGIELD
jgi:hypothetical protein